MVRARGFLMAGLCWPWARRCWRQGRREAARAGMGWEEARADGGIPGGERVGGNRGRAFRRSNAQLCVSDCGARAFGFSVFCLCSNARRSGCNEAIRRSGWQSGAIRPAAPEREGMGALGAMRHPSPHPHPQGGRRKKRGRLRERGRRDLPCSLSASTASRRRFLPPPSVSSGAWLSYL